MFLRYRPNTETVLKDLSFEVQPGFKVGVVGRTGAGKSTISLTLTRIVEIFDGQILIDGLDIQKLPLEVLRSKVTIIPQDATMFKETLRYNMDPQNKESDERIIELLKEAGLENLL